MVGGYPRRCAMPSPDSTDVDVTVDAEVDLPEQLTVQSITSLVRHVLVAEGHDGDWEMAVRFVDDPTMQAAHVEFMGIDEPTDIMTFPYGGDDDIWGDASAGGDLMISVDRAKDHATDAGWDELDELHFLIIHGVLHLIGWNDHTAEDRAAMLIRQRELLDSWPDRPGALLTS